MIKQVVCYQFFERFHVTLLNKFFVETSNNGFVLFCCNVHICVFKCNTKLFTDNAVVIMLSVQKLLINVQLLLLKFLRSYTKVLFEGLGKTLMVFKANFIIFVTWLFIMMH